MKPRIKRAYATLPPPMAGWGVWGWQCAGDGHNVWGFCPEDAYRNWLARKGD